MLNKFCLMIVTSFFCIMPSYAENIVVNERGLVGNWIEHKPGGDTSCARGTDFSFFVSPGSVNKVIVDFMGGGACWNGETCDEGGPFSDSVDYVRERAENGLSGLYDREMEDNPFKDWHHVVIPYCTGDIHWGEKDKTYLDRFGDSFEIKHRGATNAKSVLNWISDNYSSPDKIMVTGCSAGSYGSIYWTPHIKKRFSRSKIYQFGDSGVGIITPEFTRKMVNNWNPNINAPTWIPELDPRKVNWKDLRMNDLYLRISSTYPDIKFSQFTSKFDGIQTFFYELMGGLPEEWSDKMTLSMDSLTDKISNFNNFIGEGEEHCILPHESFYTKRTEGVLFKEWLSGFIRDENVGDVRCVNCEEILD